MAEAGCLKDGNFQNLEVAGLVTGGKRNIITWNASRTLLESESGSFVHASAAEAGTLTLPTAASGLEYDISIGIAQTGATRIDASGNGYFLGYLQLTDGSSTENFLGALPDGNSNDWINLNTDGKGRLAGGHMNIVCDGTNWHVNGTLIGSGTLATPFADA